MKPYEILDISGDAGIRALGENLPELFINAAAGMYSLITDMQGIRAVKTIEICSKGNSLSGLLVSFLNELIFQFDAYGFIGKKLAVTSLDENIIVTKIQGEVFDPERHERKLLVKAATYHGLKLEQKDGTWQAEIIFDI